MVIPRGPGDEDRLTIARLEARVTALEEALERRSRELRALQRHLCPADLAILVRIVNGLPALPSHAFEPELWDEGSATRPADVEDTLGALWASLAPDSSGSDVD
jgi:hypothetical protein